MKKELSYNEAIEESINELKRYINVYGTLTLGNIMDEPIYPNNEELKADFTDEYGFIIEDFISFLIRNSDYVIDTVWDAGVNDYVYRINE